MVKPQFQISEWGLVFGLAILLAAFLAKWLYRKNKNSPAFLYSDITSFLNIEKTLKVRLIDLPSFLKKGALIAFALALCHPVLQLPIEKDKNPVAQNNDLEPYKEKKMENRPIPSEGLAIYFVLDQSGSMREEMEFSFKGKSFNRRMSRFEVLKFFTAQFISGNAELGLQGRENDLIGLISFARVPKIMVPLTLDHEMVNQALSQFAPVSHPKEEGTAIGYAIYKTAHMIAATEHFSKDLIGNDKPAYDIKSTIMILVTDGLQNPSHEDIDHPLRKIQVEQAAAFAKEKKVRLYIVNIQPNIDFPELRAEREVQKKAAELTGGQFFLASDTQSLHRIYQVIDSLEKSKHYGTHPQQIQVEEIKVLPLNKELFHELKIYLSLIQLGLVLLFLAIILETTVLKRLP